jgi:hypothetical protein
VIQSPNITYKRALFGQLIESPERSERILQGISRLSRRMKIKYGFLPEIARKIENKLLYGQACCVLAIQWTGYVS